MKYYKTNETLQKIQHKEVIKVNKKSGNVTIYDISKAAGVSVSTVSKILNNTEHKFREETRKLVLETAEKLGYKKKNYTSNKNSKLLANNIAVVVPDITNPYYASLVNGLESSLLLYGMSMSFHISCNNQELEVEITKQLLDTNCKAVIIVSICNNYQHIKKLIDAGTKVLAFEQDVNLDCNKVGFDYFKGGFMATEFLINNGFDEIGFISSPLTRNSRVQVFDGYKKALKKYNIPFKEEFVKVAKNEINNIDGIGDYENGIEQVSKMLSDGKLPKSIFCINDMTAIGVMRKLQDEGLDIPNDVSIIGFDNINFSHIVRPKLTTIEQSTYELGAMAAEILIGSLKDSNRRNVSIILEPKLIIRESVLIKNK